MQAEKLPWTLLSEPSLRRRGAEEEPDAPEELAAEELRRRDESSGGRGGCSPVRPLDASSRSVARTSETKRSAAEAASLRPPVVEVEAPTSPEAPRSGTDVVLSSDLQRAGLSSL